MGKTNFFNELTGVRAIAAYLVFFHHLNIFSERKFGWFIHGFVNEFHIGVTFFFVLSGFLICYRYYDNIKLRDKKWIVQYIQNRVARIYPMYFLITTLTFIVFYLASKNISQNIILYILNITFLRGFFDSFKWTGIGQGWTLTVEECFYFSAPLIFILSRKVKLIVPFLAIFFTGIILVLVFRNVNFYDFFGNFRFMILYTYFGRCFEFFVGIKLALLYKKTYQYQTWNKRWRTLIGALWVIICIAALVLVKGDEQYGTFTPIGMAINNIILPIGIAILYLGLITERTFVKRLLGTDFFVLLGKSSYTFYLIHVGVISKMIMKFTGRNISLSFVILNILSVALFKLIEDPSNKSIRKMNVYSFLTRFKKKNFYPKEMSNN